MYITFLTSISLAAASALLCDGFFFISVIRRRLQVGEIKILRILCGVSSVSSLIAGVSLIKLMAMRISDGVTPGEGILLALSLMLLVAFTSSVSMRNLHLPALHRHQHDYHHISESFLDHQRSLISTGAVSIVTWIFIITIVAADARGLALETSFFKISILYVITAYLFSKLALVIKRKIRS